MPRDVNVEVPRAHAENLAIYQEKVSLLKVPLLKLSLLKVSLMFFVEDIK